jgi:hypothetical protein
MYGKDKDISKHSLLSSNIFPLDPYKEKQLNFLENQLLPNDNKPVIFNKYEKYSKMRDKRLQELWVNDMSIPDTTEIIEKVQAKKESRLR